MRSGFKAFVAALALALLMVTVGAQNSGLPAGGNDLLVRVLEACRTCDALAELATMERSQEEWRAYFREQQHEDETLPEDEGALAELSDAEIATLTAYLALHLPLDDEALGEYTDAQALPLGGRELLRRHCTGCHSLAVSVLPDWQTREAWTDLLEDANHRGIGLSERQVTELAAYLALNPIAPEDVE